MLKGKLIAAILLTGAILWAAAAGERAAADSVYSKLMASRDALSAQEREIQRAYDEVGKQIDELRSKQTVLDQYLKQTQSSLREIDRAISQSN